MNSKQFVIVLVITFAAGMVWLVSDIIFNTKASIPISEKLQSSLEPINPTFNSRVLEVISGETLSTNQITVNSAAAPAISESSDAIDPLVSPQPSPSSSSPTLIPTPSNQPSPTPNLNLTPIVTLPASGTASANPTP